MIISIEGADQAGKTTQAEMLVAALEQHGLSTRTFAFPDYSTPVGTQIRASLERTDATGHGPPQLLHTLLAANRWEALPRIRAALAARSVVVMNRYYHSNLAYGMARGLDRYWLKNLDAGLPESDIVIVLDIDAAESFRRKRAGRDSFESDRGLLERARYIYCREACWDRRRWKVVDAIGTREDVHSRVFAAAVPAVNRLCGTQIELPEAVHSDPPFIQQILKLARGAAATVWRPPGSASS